MEAAVESGKHVADLITNTQTVLPQHEPIMVIPFKWFDSILYSMGLPNIVNVCLLIIVILFVLLCYKYFPNIRN